PTILIRSNGGTMVRSIIISTRSKKSGKEKSQSVSPTEINAGSGKTHRQEPMRELRRPLRSSEIFHAAAAEPAKQRSPSREDQEILNILLKGILSIRFREILSISNYMMLSLVSGSMMTMTASLNFE